uniref:Uncharacterized protein n=1 Tax=Rousettus aegyptiacus TaxID=9407 RepID=A0A7J8H0Z5_ROUAE|nr:hypothetical protein HJG63_011261 [Rousettus aegyptiacus]
MSSIFSNHNGMKLENHYKKTEKHTNTWGLNNMLLTNEWVNNQFEVEIKRYFETNENEHIMTQNLWDIAKAVLKGKFIVIQTHLKKQDKSQVITLKKLEKEKQIKLKVRIGREITKIRVVIK